MLFHDCHRVIGNHQLSSVANVDFIGTIMVSFVCDLHMKP